MANSLRPVLTAAFLAGIVAASSAQVAFNDFSSSNGGFGYDDSDGYTLQGSVANGGLIDQAMEFTSLATGYLSDVYIPIGDQNGAGNVTVSLETESGGKPSGSALDSWTFGSDGHAFNTYLTPSLLNGNFAALTAGSNYWLVVAPADPSGAFRGAWFLNNSGAIGNEAYNQGSGWNKGLGLPLATFRVDLSPTPTPEPFTIALGVAGLGFAARRKARAKRV